MTTTMFYLPAEGIDPATIYGEEDITCISAEEIQRLGTEWGTDVMSQMRPATPEEMAEYGIYGHACTLYEIWTDEFEVRCKKGDPWTTDELLGEYLRKSSIDPHREASYTSLEEARTAFAKSYANHGSTRLMSGSAGYYLLCSIAYLDGADYDEDGELDQGCDTWEVSLEEYVPALHDLVLARADTELIVRLINAEDSWDDDQHEALLELADRAGLDEEDYLDDDGYTDVHAFVCAIQDALGVDLGE